jgi:hypothetical protein
VRLTSNVSPPCGGPVSRALGYDLKVETGP